ncbi:MAG: DNA replication/repair protein RecF [Anaerovoracaceae bacterium]|jgi:DNA replication and repair protein RecF
MYIDRAQLHNFRNYREESFEFDRGLNLIVGENAQGKTNLIESLYLCALGKSFRTARDRDLIRFKEQYCRVVCQYERDGEEDSIEVALARDGRKSIKVGGISLRRTTDLLDHLLVVIFSPEDLKIVKEDPSRRRNFLDRELSQLRRSYVHHLKLYQRVLSQRNAYLKEHEDDCDGLFIWDEKLVEFGTVLMEERDRFLERLSAISGRIHDSITAGREQLTLIYRPNIRRDPEHQKEVIAAALEKGRDSDFFNGSTGRGPHKDDFEVVINDVNARNYGSQGQQRTAALSLKLAEIALLREEKEEAPVLLLDDVLSELDPQRQQYLIRALESVQLFITTTEITDEMMEALPDGKVIRIADGRQAD